MGVAAGNYIASKHERTSNPVIAEIAGIDNLPLTQDRSQGFKETLAQRPRSARQAAAFTVESGKQVTANMLQAEPKIDAMWNHDDDQGVGVLAAIQQANRKEFFMVGGAGSATRWGDQGGPERPEGHGDLPPTMASSAVSLARLVAQDKGMTDLVEKEVPASITLASATITKENVDQYIAWASSPDRLPRKEAQCPQDRPTLGVGMVGYAFMGAAHSQAWRTVGRVFDLPLAPDGGAVRTQRKVAAAAAQLGWDSVETDWKALSAGRRTSGRHLHAG